MITDTTLDDIPQILELTKSCFGENFITKSSLFQDVSLTYKLDGQIIGFTTGGNIRHCKLLRDVLGQQNYHMLHNIGVHPDHRKRGIARLLTAEVLKRFGAVDVCASAWKYPDGYVPVARTLEHFNFTTICELPNFWAGSSCLHCGNSCGCAAVVYLRKHNESSQDRENSLSDS